MTLRLVALMCAVLLLSLAAFGLIVAHYQDQLMAEVANTASAVGQATLHELRGVSFRWSGDMVWHGQAPADATGEKTIRIVERTLETAEDQDVAIVTARVGDAECLAGAGAPAEPGAGTGFDYLIEVEQVRAEPDPARGLVLRIPTVAPAPAAGSLLTRHEEIRLPIPLREYDRLFASMRGRTLFLFLGVLAVGALLSAGLAAHFTRPIRKLDAAIRRLSDGDLDVSVPVAGQDEIGRLSRAFNEMAGKLRANRERGREIVRREKLSALGRLAAGVAHDVRNPLHSIGLTLQHLEETARPGEDPRAGEFDRAVGIIRGEIRRLDRLIENFLRFAKSERQERLPVDLAGLLRETARLVQKEAERRGVRLGLEIDADVPAVRADGEALRSSILNLVLNSFEAMPEGGTLTIRLRAEGAEVVLEVADTGEGIPEADRERVFEFAYTTREGGHGLGLAMVHHCVVEEHGGRVGLDSRPGEGTRVRLALPVGAAAAA